MFLANVDSMFWSTLTPSCQHGGPVYTVKLDVFSQLRLDVLVNFDPKLPTWKSDLHGKSNCFGKLFSQVANMDAQFIR